MAASSPACPGGAHTEVCPTLSFWEGTGITHIIIIVFTALAEASWEVLLIRAPGSCHTQAAAGEMASGGHGGESVHCLGLALLLLGGLTCQGMGRTQKKTILKSPSSLAFPLAWSVCLTLVWISSFLFIWETPMDKWICNTGHFKLTF